MIQHSEARCQVDKDVQARQAEHIQHYPRGGPTAPGARTTMRGCQQVLARMRRRVVALVACYVQLVTPEELRALRAALNCTARELAVTLGIDPGEIVAWEQGERFPTKKLVADLTKLGRLGPEAVSRKPRRRAQNALRGTARLADPTFWQLVRKIAEHPELFDRVCQVAQDYTDPVNSTAFSS
jgi:transcriptional regulator with XRE-family HTH domain